ncbi:jg4291 [Pararge aegeria aegeria]|uniref:Jg4291 protein n=1 Tax=Pararge aegeria aegeria TaxID=348720 RepID=A0A8S4RJM1_9NEOP|nr:jg4291 [Pararge aegeria aegeria]
MLGRIPTCLTGRCGYARRMKRGEVFVRGEGMMHHAKVRRRTHARTSPPPPPAPLSTLPVPAPTYSCVAITYLHSHAAANVALDRVRASLPSAAALPLAISSGAAGRRGARRSHSSRSVPPRRVALRHSAIRLVVEQSSSTPVGFGTRLSWNTRSEIAIPAAPVVRLRLAISGVRGGSAGAFATVTNTGPAAADKNSVRYHRDLGARRDEIARGRRHLRAAPHVRVRCNRQLASGHRWSPSPRPAAADFT